MWNNEENILREFCYLSEVDLLMEIQEEVRKYMILTKSEEEAINILKKYGKEIDFSFNDHKKVKYNRLMIYAKYMNLVIPNEWYDVLVTDDDIIERIKESMYDEIKWINSYSYVYDCCSNNDIVVFTEEENDYVLLPSDVEINKIQDFYNDVINEEFGNSKKLVK